MPEMTLYDAVGGALVEEMRHDPRVLVFGEGVATKRRDLVQEFGALRVRNTPLAEGIIAGTAVGAAGTGLRPVIDLLFAPFLCYAMDELVNSAGKLRYIGASQFMAWQLARANLLAEFRGWSPFVVVQSHYHLLEREIEREVLPFCREQGVGVIPFFPLAGGFLTGKYLRGQPAPAGSRGETSTYVQQYMTEANYTRVELLSTWAGARGRGLNELAQAWLLAHPEVSSVISGATSLEQMQANARAADWVLSAAEMEEIGKILG